MVFAVHLHQRVFPSAIVRVPGKRVRDDALDTTATRECAPAADKPGKGSEGDVEYEGEGDRPKPGKEDEVGVEGLL